MSFSAQTCITNTGTTQLGPTLYFYSDVDGYQGVFGSDSTENLIGGNCPYTMENIPDGTTVVRIIDPTTNCCLDINLQSNDLCNTYNLNFDVYETQTVSQIVAGNLIGDTVSNISDYIINWYGPGEGSTELAFTSGYGTAFSDIGWNLTHPLTGTSSPLIEAGVYTPVIDRVIVNGTTFSSTGAPDTYIANLNCFDSSVVTVEPLRCDNGNNPGDYSHHYLFNNVSVGNPPESLSASFIVSANTDYLAWKFRGFQVYDTIKLTFYGSEYDNIPLIIENARIGSGVGTPNVGVNTNPKLINSDQFIKKVTCLTAFTINEGDYITIQITPNPANYNTQWDFYFTCLEKFDCETCYDQFQNNSPKIDLSSVSVTELPCNRVQIFMNMSGCTLEDIITTDVGKYFLNGIPNTIATIQPELFEGNTLYFTQESCVFNSCEYTNTPPQCSLPSGIYSFSKSIIDGVGQMNFSFNLLSDLEYYYNDYQNLISCLGGGYDNTQLDYYRYFKLIIPIPSSPDEQCGDTTPPQTYYLHHTSVVTTGGTGPYTMTITMPTIIKNITFTNCQGNCEYYIQQQVNYINESSLSQINNFSFTTNTGSRYLNPFRNGIFFILQNESNLLRLDSDFITNWQFQNETYVYSVNNVLVPSLTGKTCEYKGEYSNNFYSSGGYGYFQYTGDWKLELTNPANITDFQVLVNPITDWIPDNDYPVTALTYTNGSITYSNPDYTF
jgi:hypothetical protein